MKSAFPKAAPLVSLGEEEDGRVRRRHPAHAQDLVYLVGADQAAAQEEVAGDIDDREVIRHKALSILHQLVELLGDGAHGGESQHADDDAGDGQGVPQLAPHQVAQRFHGLLGAFYSTRPRRTA